MNRIFCLYSLVTNLRHNILFFGNSGVGKSCLINTLLTDESKPPITPKVIAKTREYDVDVQCTHRYNQYTVNDNVQVFDTLGWNPGANYKGEEFDLMLNGRIPSNGVCQELGADDIVDSSDERIIDVVCFVLSGEEDIVTTVEQMKPFIKKTMDHGKSFCFILTKMDLVCGRIECSQDPKFREIQMKVLKTLRISGTNVFPIINYTHLDIRKIELIKMMKEPIMNFFITCLEKSHSSDNVKKLSLVEGEILHELKHPSQIKKNYDVSNFKEKVELRDSQGVILPNQSAHCAIEMDNMKFILFFTTSFVCQDHYIVGVLEENQKVYFESTIQVKSSNDIHYFLERSFDGKSHVPDFLYLDKDGNTFKKYQEKYVVFLRLDLKSLPVILLKRKRFGSIFHTSLEDNNQMKKFVLNQISQMGSLKNKHDESANDLKKIVKKKDKIIEKNKTETEKNKAENLIQRQEIDDLKDQMRKKDEIIEIIKSENQNQTQEIEELKTQMKRMKESRNDIIQEVLLRILEEKELEEKKRREIEEEEKRRRKKDIEEKRRRMERRRREEKKRREEEKKRKEEEKKRKELLERNPSKCLSPEQFKELNKICGFDRSWKLLFRGSENGFEASTFHSKCDNIPGTLMIVKTDKNYVLGGFNPARWNEKPDGYHKVNGAWIFGFIKENNNQEEKIIKINYDGTENYGIYCTPSFGPIFGAGQAIILCSDCNIDDRSYTRLSQGSGYTDGGRGKCFLNGGTRYFKVLEYEVYTK